MAKQKPVLPVRERRDRSRNDDSLLLRSAESLGRVIGALQRELERATRRLSSGAQTKIDRPAQGRAARTHDGARGGKKTKTKKAAATKKKTATRKKAAPRASKKPPTGARTKAPGAGRKQTRHR